MFSAASKTGSQPSAAANYIEDVFSTYLYTGNGASQTIVNNIALANASSSQFSLKGYTTTNLGGAFYSGYPLSNVTDGIVETTNAANIGYVASSDGYFDIYVDLLKPAVITAYNIAPQGTASTGVYNTPTDFIVKASNDGSTWTTITTFSSISTGYPAWDAGTFRVFSFSNTTGYRYWRIQNTSFGSAGAGVTMSEWNLTGTTTATVKGGLVWTKIRSTTGSNLLNDTVRGADKTLFSNTTGVQVTSASGTDLVAFNTNGYSIGPNYYGPINTSSQNFCSWTFAEQAKFFDIVTYTGDGNASKTISHNLGSTPGMVIVKKTSGTSNWIVWAKVSGTDSNLRLNTTDAATSDNWIYSVTSTQFVAAYDFGGGALDSMNDSGATYVAYLFAHNAGGFGTTGADNVISCGSYTGNGSTTGPVITLGYEPQYVLIKGNIAGGNWLVFDNMRGIPTGGTDPYLLPNSSAAEGTGLNNALDLTATGFQITNTSGQVNNSGTTYIYMAIRRPMKVPTDATTVFNVSSVGSGTFATNGFPTDFYLGTATTGLAKNDWDRLRGGKCLFNNLTNGESAFDYTPYLTFDNNTQFKQTADGNIDINYYFSRRPKFFDTVCYTGTGTATTQAHNLGVAPEMMIIKKRSGTGDWFVYSATGIDTGKTYPYPRLNGDEDGWFGTVVINATAPTSSVFTINSTLNTSTSTYVASLFATCPGVSKVGSYTGNGTTQAISCGFTGGARFVIIKRTDATGGWYLYDTVRGMTTLVDPYLFVNDTSAQTATLGSVTTTAGGFTVNAAILAAINTNAASYIFLAIA
jgi:hypothetical protein